MKYIEFDIDDDGAVLDDLQQCGDGKTNVKQSNDECNPPERNTISGRNNRKDIDIQEINEWAPQQYNQDNDMSIPSNDSCVRRSERNKIGKPSTTFGFEKMELSVNTQNDK